MYRLILLLCFLSPYFLFGQKTPEFRGFIENKGQILDQNHFPNSQVQYLLPGKGMNVQIRTNGFSYDLFHSSFTSDSTRIFSYNRIDFDFAGQNKETDFVAGAMQEGRLHYYTTGNGVDGVRDVRQYGRVLIKNIYNNIDIEYLSDSDGGFKYNFLLNENSDVSEIKFTVSGALTSICNDGSLLLVTSGDTVRETIPSCYAEINGQSKPLSMRFISLGNGIFGLICDNMPDKYTRMVIDPVPVRYWGTYYGGTEGESIVSLSIDRTGNIYAIGYTMSDNNIATAGAHQVTLGGDNDAFILKITSEGTLIWCTYYGGNQMDLANGISLDKEENLYVSGVSFSLNNISTPGSFQPVSAGSGDAFLVRFDTSGLRIWCTYYGAIDEEGGYGCCTDDAGNIYVTGTTCSTSGITTPGSFQEIFGGGDDDLYIVKFDKTGNRKWCTYYGGVNTELIGCYSNIVSDGAFFYLIGYTKSTNAIATPGSFQSTFGGGVSDGFMVKFDTTGNRIWGTYYGGPGIDAFTTVRITTDHNIAVAGTTNSNTGIASPGSFQPALGGSSDCFVARFVPDGARKWATYYGGNASDETYGITSDLSGNIYIGGSTQSGNGISTPDAFQVNLAGQQDGFIANLDSSGNRIWGTYYGGSEDDWGQGCYSVDCGPLYFFGMTDSPDNVTTPGAHQTTYQGMIDGLLVRFGDYLVPGDPGNISGPAVICTPDTVTYSIAPVQAATGYNWIIPAGCNILSGANTNIIVVEFTTSAISDTIFVFPINDCATGRDSFLSLTINQINTVSVSITSTSNNVCEGESVTFTALPHNEGSAPAFEWKVNGLITGTNLPVFNYIPQNNDVVTCILTSSLTSCIQNNPAVSNEITVTVTPGVPMDISITSSANNVCSGTSVTFTATPTGTGTLSYDWKLNSLSQGVNSSTFIYPPANGDVVTCVLTSSITTCVSNNPATSNTITMVVNPLQPVDITISPSQNNVCEGAQVTFTSTVTPAGGINHYQWTVNNIPSGSDLPTFTFMPVNGDVVKCEATVTGLTCLANSSKISSPVTMVINPNVTTGITITAASNPVCGGIPVTFTAVPVNGGTPVFQWQVNGVNAGTGLSGYTYTPVNGDIVTCSMTTSLSCAIPVTANSNPVGMTVIASPAVTYTHCTDTITTLNARPFKLKGGIPLGGTYSGQGVNPLTGIFTPSVAGTGTKTIAYSYTNSGSCSDSKTRIIKVVATPVFSCGNMLTDVRDNKTYQTIQIGSQCWMAEDLRYGNSIPESQHQRDNCSVEKFCSTVNCQPQTANLYQWDEMMDYNPVAGEKGLCPAGWHIPDESEWQTLFSNYTNNAFAGAALKYSGFSQFNAMMTGTVPQITTLQLYQFATFFWSSSANGPNKAWAHGFNEPDPSVSLYSSTRENAFAVRCLKD
ncbi:MAG: FISUMP domain-containing protein [Syntrophothermus sp.]